MKRYQECNIFGKIFRLRWYLCIPFIFIYAKIMRKDGEFNNKTLWSLIEADMQSNMKWYYTSEEVNEMFIRKNKKK